MISARVDLRNSAAAPLLAGAAFMASTALFLLLFRGRTVPEARPA